MKVRDLIRELQRFDPEARVVLSAGGHQLPHPSVGVGLQAATREPCVVVADRASFAGRLPDLLLLIEPGQAVPITRIGGAQASVGSSTGSGTTSSS